MVMACHKHFMCTVRVGKSITDRIPKRIAKSVFSLVLDTPMGGYDGDGGEHNL